jgi:hypothetical protein
MDFRINNALKLVLEHLKHEKSFRGLRPWTPGERTEKGKGKGERTEEKKVMEKEGLKKGKGNWEARR